MSDILAQILAHKRDEVERAQTARPLATLRSMPGFAAPPRNFYGAVSAPRRGGPNLIAEIKRASPSAGVIKADFDPVAIARSYADAGAHALSVLTDEKFFDGRLEYIEQVKGAVGLPVLRKDFILDLYQVHESRAYGADAILLIAEALTPPLVNALTALAHDLGLCVLLEAHGPAALNAALRALPAGLRDGLLVGINNRDLKAQTIDLATTENVARIVPPGLPIVSESGIKTRQDVERLHAAGARALLIGETLMRSADPRAMVRSLFGG